MHVHWNSYVEHSTKATINMTSDKWHVPKRIDVKSCRWEEEVSLLMWICYSCVFDLCHQSYCHGGKPVGEAAPFLMMLSSQWILRLYLVFLQLTRWCSGCCELLMMAGALLQQQWMARSPNLGESCVNVFFCNVNEFFVDYFLSEWHFQTIQSCFWWGYIQLVCSGNLSRAVYSCMTA